MNPRKQLARAKRIRRRLQRKGWRWIGKDFRRPRPINIEEYAALIWKSTMKHRPFFQMLKEHSNRRNAPRMNA